MENSSRSEKIISQAVNWNFEGDCSLLEWMQEISQNLEQRATATGDALKKLGINVNRTAISLDNAANSLTALQYTQFVESRCHDDDETVANIKSEIESFPADTTASAKSKPSNEVLKILLRKNLQMLNSSHEKFALDFEDSDEDETATANNYIYQPKNPYNDAPLPHIYGSKLWKEHWHVGLCDGSNEYSGDEASDAFSVSFSSSATDNESFESNSANLSEWASSTSIPIETHPAQMPKQGTSGSVSKKHLSISKPIPSNVDSDSYSQTSRSTTTNPLTRERDVNVLSGLRHDSPVTSTSVSSSPHKYSTPLSPPLVQTQRNVDQRTLVLPPFIDATPPPANIFAADTRKASMQEPIIDHAKTESLPNQSVNIYNTRKPLNLFDDNDFNSFFNKPEDSSQQTRDYQQSQLPVPATRNLPTQYQSTLPPVEQASVSKTIDLFAETLNTNKASVENFTKVAQIEKPKEIIQRQPVNLFDDSPEGSPPNEMFFSASAKSGESINNNVKPAAKRNITAKSLFDDDEDDDDFLNVFGSKNITLPQRSMGKTLLFGDDDGNEGIKQITKEKSKLTSNLFDDTPSENTDEVSSEQNESKQGNDKEAPTQLNQESKKVIPPPVKPNNQIFSGDLFEDNAANDFDNLPRKQPPSRQSIKSFDPKENVSQIDEEPKNSIISEVIRQRKSLFGDESDDDSDDLFGKTQTEEEINENNKNFKETVEQPNKANIANDKGSTDLLRERGIFKTASLFADDFDDDAEEDLFGVKPQGIQEALKPKYDENKKEKEMTPKDILKSVENERQTTRFLLCNATNSHDKLTDILKETDKDLNKQERNNMLNDPVSANTDELQSKTILNEPLLKSKNFVTGGESVEVGNTVEQAKVTNNEILISTKQHTESEDIDHMEKINNAQTLSGDQDKKSNNTLTQDVNKTGSHLTKTDFASDDLFSSETVKNPSADTKPQPPTLSKLNDATLGGNHKYSGIFLDEPPDDDDFFTSLSSSSKQMSISKLTLDLENDFYEPALPSVPNTTINGANTQDEASNKYEQGGNSEYGGLRLFSDIPPDDDGNEFFCFAGPSSKNSSQITAVNQRLHNVFYDDFTETLAAVQKMKENENKITFHTIFDDKPPVDEDFVDVIAKVEQVKKMEVEEKKKEEDKFNKMLTKDQSTVKGLIDERNNVGKETTRAIDEIDRVTPKAITIEKPRNSVANKLQMPNININVKALLPGGGGSGIRPTFKNQSTLSEQSKTSSSQNEISETPNVLRKEFSKASPSSITSGTSNSENENLLSSVCKTRVRAPAGRRPSTRRARQENYRQSLLTEKEEEIVEKEEAPSSSISSKQQQQQQQQQHKEQVMAKESNKTPDKITTEKGTLPLENNAPATIVTNLQSANAKATEINFFLEDYEDANDSLFGTSLPRNASKQIVTSLPADSKNRNTPASTKETLSIPATVKNISVGGHKDSGKNHNSDDLFDSVDATALINTNTFQQKKVSSTTTTTATKSLFGTPSSSDADFDDNDNDLFKSNKKSKSIKSLSQTTKKTASISNIKLNSIFGTDDEDDDEFLSNLKTKPKTGTKFLTSSGDRTTKKQQPSSSGGLFSDIESDGDDLFGGGKSKPKNVVAKEKTTILPKSHLSNVNSAMKPTNTKAVSENSASLSDNPLADLLKP